MKDFDYENLQKKRDAQGARHKKNGSKSRKCTLPHDHYTPAQLQALNGPVTTILLNQPMDWETFTGLSDTLKVKYIQNLQDTYQVSLRMLAQMFDVTAGTVRSTLTKLDIKTKCPSGAGKRNNARRAAWDAFCNGVVGGGDNVQTEEPKEVEPQVTCYDIDAEELERAKIAAELQTDAEEETTTLCDPRPPYHVNASRCDDPVEPDPDEELANAVVDALNKAFTPLPCKMQKLETSMTGAPEGVVDNIRDLLSLFSGSVNVEIKIFADNGYGGDAD